MSDALHHFDNENSIDYESVQHTYDVPEDLKQVIFQKLSMRSTKIVVFTNIPGRKHTSFPSITCNMFGSIDQLKFQEWMDTKFAKLLAATNY